jgi:catechol 2,3-dioxygenase-like lactoylglutathione lyase family enzyme
MLQLELYVGDVAETAKLFSTVFGMELVEERPGWRQLNHPDNFVIMLFDPTQHPDIDSFWGWPLNGNGGSGIEIVITTQNIGERRLAVQALGYICSELRYPPWGSTEFVFQLQEGYLLRIKQPRPGNTND